MQPHAIPLIRLSVFVAALSAISLVAQSPSTPAAPPSPPPVNHEFDFWLGDWNVTTPDGKPAGTNRIESVSNGRGLLEDWVGDPAVGGGNGKSLNAYNLSKKEWQQFWIGSGGGVLELSGGLVGGKMVLTGSHVVRGATLNERISYTPNGDGSVRQVWDQSRDGGKTWTNVFDGIYRRK